MNILFFEFEPEYSDALAGIFKVRNYDIAYAFVNEENSDKLAAFSDSINSQIKAVIITDKDTAEKIIEKTILEVLQRTKSYSAFFTICHAQKALEKTALKLSTSAKIKACFVCLEDSIGSIFDIPDAQFIRMCFDNEDCSESNSPYVSSNKKVEPYLVGKFAFLEKILHD